jgi:hypothetical protein
MYCRRIGRSVNWYGRLPCSLQPLTKLLSALMSAASPLSIGSALAIATSGDSRRGEDAFMVELPGVGGWLERAAMVVFWIVPK